MANCCPRRQRPSCRRTAEQRYEVASACVEQWAP